MMRPCSIAVFAEFLIRAFRSDDDQLVDLLILAIAPVVIGLEVADERAFDDCLGGVVDGARHDEGEALQVLRLQRTNRRTRQLAQLGRREGFCLSSADEQEALSLHALRLVE